MKKLWMAALACVLAACGAVGRLPEPQPGNLLSAPTTLIVQGQVLTAQASASLYGGGLGVRVQVSAPARPGTLTPAVTPAGPLGNLTLDGVFVVTGQGTWKAPLHPSLPARGGAASLNAAAWSGSGSLRRGDQVQVVVRLKDRLGHTYWLRDTGRVSGS
ncbi:hypothetical protein [Deinococcus aquaticus]|uniref:DUF5666 domain-containing protein n=1 Tax=Deinococcus aquaticus TaxID=328692 RepID=A0ABY7V127_9DEIO|nr:hypothetical protein [Deinococcus aquaticus]WDA57833.1 hypothetical protein M8445_10780 [Deinococcus aquaticus]